MQIQRECGTSLTLSLLKSVTESFAKVIHGLQVGHLADRVIQRSKRMILDTLGVGILGTSTDVFHKASKYSKVRSPMSTLDIKPSVHICLLMSCPHGSTRRCMFVFYYYTLHFRDSSWHI